jgi:hypothetical protein
MRMIRRRKVKWVRHYMREGDKTFVKMLLGNYREKGQLGDLRIELIIILKRTLDAMKQCGLHSLG